ncbi:hypothetical protein JR316_0012716 [Psilocybe cubensis]|uniref:Uncharacterized protein n=2 Tax=Psilocybe cubensis TaxID=181762 RepID=A0ACB8GJ22_PSICU|nr:hypothetical protein JR316_0012716 [Psilocybe cubensis]KAH9475599.1 hypothetical protein JR316_0012716 [Psilocybe cubensis]
MSITGNARKLTFVSKNLGKDIDLMLMFDPPKEGTLFTDLYPVCWKVLQFSASNISTAVVVYTADTAFIVPQANDDSNIVSALNVERCQGGQVCSLMTNNKGNNYLTHPGVGTPGIIQCKIQSAKPADLAFGIMGKDQSVAPIFKWTGLGVDSTLAVKLTPVLRIYGVSDYHSSEILTANVNTDELFRQDLTQLPHETTWNVVRDPSSLQLKIVRAK